MNERIKELYEQSLIRETGKDHAGNPMLVIKQNPEKFAELIVRECAKFLDENSGYDDSNNAWHPEPEDLLQHFGVEE
jgi:hypothetical protein